jgi:hypothetical protein
MMAATLESFGDAIKKSPDLRYFVVEMPPSTGERMAPMLAGRCFPGSVTP